MAFLTIHTATYNRAYILGKAYESLRAQTCKDFEWIITDDGSSDDTRELVRSWINRDNGFEIIYNPLSHVGVPRALNSGVNLSRTNWFLMLDSDDYLVPKAIEKIVVWLKELDCLPNDYKIGGIGFCKCYPNGEYVKPQKPLIDPSVGYVDATHLERAKYNLNMDCCEVHSIKLMKDFPFPCWATECFAPEQLSLYGMALSGWKLRWRDEKLYICDYLPDGLTRNNKLVLNNPMGFAMMYNQNMSIWPGIRNHWRDAVQMIALSFYSRNLSYLKKSNDKFATILLLPIGILLGLRRKSQFKKLSK